MKTVFFRISSWFVALPLIVTLTGCSLGMLNYETAQSEQTLDIDPAGDSPIRIHAKTSNGAISYVGNDQTNLRVKAVKRVRAKTQDEADSFLGQVTVRGIESEGEIRIVVDHPKPPRHTSVMVSYDMEGPGTTNLKLETSNGAISVVGTSGSLETKSSNGKIHLQTVAGTVAAETSNGAVRVDGLEMGGPLRIETSNGSIHAALTGGGDSITAVTSNGAIDLQLPDGFSGTLAAKTSNGRVRCDSTVEITDSEPRKKNRLNGILGAGGESVVRLQSSNGSIHVH